MKPLAVLAASLILPICAHAQIPSPARIDSAPVVQPAEQPTSHSSSRRAQPLILVTSEALDAKRSNQLVAGVAIGQSLLLRSASSLTPKAATDRWIGAAISPDFLFVTNSALPFSQNYGAMWAGRGVSTRTLFGYKLEGARARIIIAPELILSANAEWTLDSRFFTPAVPPGRSEFAMPYYAGAFTIDIPMRYGDNSIRRIDLGQTTALVAAKSLEFGFANENEWWGPGIRNAIVLSNNAPGFPHLFVRTARPLNTKLGGIEFRWLVGGLTESAFFDTVSTNNTRSISAIAATLQTGWDPNLSFGIARSVYGTTKSWGPVFTRWFDVLAPVHLDAPDTSQTQRDQLFTLFGRWVFPEAGVEMYGEWGRTRLESNLRQFLVAPNHTQGYTVGMQWRSGDSTSGSVRIQGELTQLEQSATFRDVPLGSWYTSERVIQGYTNRGEPLGASIGPGSSSQWLAIDHLASNWRFGGYLGRIRWNQDVHNHYPFPIYVGYCNQDVSVIPGIRGARAGSFGLFTADLSLQKRLTPFFQNSGGCPNNGDRLDIHNTSLAITFIPFRR